MDALRERILRWEYFPGHRFVEENLCEEFGASRSPVREALRVLEAQGLVEKRPYCGYSVIQPDVDEIYWLYELRTAIEMFVAERLAEKGLPAKTLATLKENWASPASPIFSDNADPAKADREFHEILAAAADNPILLNQLKDINDRLVGLRLIDFNTEERLASTCQQHLAVLEAIEARDSDRARKAIQKNIGQSMENVQQAVQAALQKGFSSIKVH